jgi:hypothetical protein
MGLKPLESYECGNIGNATIELTIGSVRQQLSPFGGTLLLYEMFTKPMIFRMTSVAVALFKNKQFQMLLLPYHYILHGSDIWVRDKERALVALTGATGLRFWLFLPQAISCLDHSNFSLCDQELL